MKLSQHSWRSRFATALSLSATVMIVFAAPSMAEELAPAQLNEVTVRPAVSRDLHNALIEAQDAEVPPIVEEEPAVEGEGTVKAEVAVEAEAAKPAVVSGGTEVVRERFPNRMVHIERQVAQDAEGNYFNHGPWAQWDEQGRLLAKGEFHEGKRQGKWFRWYSAKQAELFSEPAMKGFELPLGTEAEFVAGELHGDWKVFDAKKRPVCTWHFENGERQGRSVWFATSGQIRQEVDFENGQMHGDLKQLNPEGQLTVHSKFVNGHRLALEVKYHVANKKQTEVKLSEGEILYATTYSKVNYDWWTGTGAVVAPPTGEGNQRHGRWTWWHPNGQTQLEGRYEYDQPIGKFTWWYPNGQRQLEGEYVGGQQHGKFVWWYATGQKHRVGEYCVGVPNGNWVQWTAEGRIIQTEDYQGKVVDRLATEQPAAPEIAAESEKPPVRVGSKDTKSRLKR